MNRREFVKALVGMPLLGLLAKLPKAKKGIAVRWTDGHIFGETACYSFVEPTIIIDDTGINLGVAEQASDGIRYWSAQETTEPILRY